MTRCSTCLKTQVITTVKGRRKIPWWRIRNRRRRNQFTFTDRIQPPLLLSHDDLNPATNDITKEDFFKALVSTGNRRKFVRYLEKPR